jgi:hypothetical protein
LRKPKQNRSLTPACAGVWPHVVISCQPLSMRENRRPSM